MPVVQPTGCTRTEEVEPRQQQALGEVMMRTNVEVMVERLWLDGPAKVMLCTVRWGVKIWSTAQNKTNVSSTEEMVQGEQNQNIWSRGKGNGATGVHRAFSYGYRWLIVWPGGHPPVPPSGPPDRDEWMDSGICVHHSKCIGNYTLETMLNLRIRRNPIGWQA